MLLIIIVIINIITTIMTTKAKQTAIQKPLFCFPSFDQSWNASAWFWFVAAAVRNTCRFIHAAVRNATQTNCYKTNLYACELLPPPVKSKFADNLKQKRTPEKGLRKRKRL